MSCNHKEAIENLTPEQYQENLKWMAKNYNQAMESELVTCRGCEDDFKLYQLYCCYFCRSYFCEGCGGNHFGDRDE